MRRWYNRFTRRHPVITFIAYSVVFAAIMLAILEVGSRLVASIS